MLRRGRLGYSNTLNLRVLSHTAHEWTLLACTMLGFAADYCLHAQGAAFHWSMGAVAPEHSQMMLTMMASLLAGNPWRCPCCCCMLALVHLPLSFASIADLTTLMAHGPTLEVGYPTETLCRVSSTASPSRAVLRPNAYALPP